MVVCTGPLGFEDDGAMMMLALVMVVVIMLMFIIMMMMMVIMLMAIIMMIMMIYIYYDEVCVCVSQKIITSYSRAERQRRKASRPLGLTGRRPALAY